MTKPKYVPPIVFEPTDDNWKMMATPGVILILLAALIPAWFEYKLSSNQAEYDNLLENGIASQALVVEKDTQEGGMLLILDPLPQGGETITREVSEQVFQLAAVGEPLDILVLAGDPDSAQLPMDMKRPVRETFVFFFPLLAVGGLLYLRKGISLRRLSHRLIHEGLTAPVRLLARWEEKGEDDPAYFVSFSFTAQTPDGEKDMLLCTMNRKGYDAFDTRGVVKVRYLPENPKQCRLEFTE